MSTKSIPVIDASELADGQLKQVEFENGHVLLSKIGDKIHATSAFCTHYGAPLAKGVLTKDGRVVCPWHGACFQVCSGDIEDAPAPDALHSFKAEIKDGKIVVTANPEHTTKEGKSRAPKLASVSANFNEPASERRFDRSYGQNGYQGSITLISKEDYAPIDRTKLSKALITDPSKIEFRKPEVLKERYGVDFRSGTVVTNLDPTAKTVTLSNGESIQYTNVVLAPGSAPRKLPVEGADLGNVFTLRQIGDAKQIDEVLKEGKKIVFVGSSFISMELVVVASKRKLASLDVIGMEEVPFENILGKEVGAGLMKYHKSQGVNFHMQAKVKKLSGNTNVSSVTITDSSGSDKTLEADAVIMGIGVAPATEFLKSSPFTLEKDGGIAVDEYLRAPTGDLSRIEHWNVANNHGRAVGKTIAGSPQPFKKVPIFWSALVEGQQLRYCGIGAGHEDVIIKGNPDEMKFVAYYVKGDKVTAVSSMQNDPIVSKCSELMRLELMPSASEIRAGKDPLSVDISSSAGSNKLA
ncbi:apoptosis-inducing factor 1 [Rhizoctonia solani]|uniref:Apoptosis-inducing factor 1 n=1 Tax=Rhizoctonia solani TaxID=456999 RepID=A0A8H8NZL9_9AGAM|nr:apoptosis-inducing factor 1 [Rhizoctonia solani]QRW21600.1 apoptosis-inducing factor 1 [Rhizoctonia solani]